MPFRIVAATIVAGLSFGASAVFGQCGCMGTTYMPVAPAYTTYYAPSVAYYAPPAAYYAPAPTVAYYALPAAYTTYYYAPPVAAYGYYARPGWSAFGAQGFMWRGSPSATSSCAVTP